MRSRIRERTRTLITSTKGVNPHDLSVSDQHVGSSHLVDSPMTSRDSLEPITHPAQMLESPIEQLESEIGRLRITDSPSPLNPDVELENSTTVCVSDSPPHNLNKSIADINNVLFAAGVTSAEGVPCLHNKLFQSSREFQTPQTFPDSLAPLSPEIAVESIRSVLMNKATSMRDRAASRSSLPRTQAFPLSHKSFSKKISDAKAKLEYIRKHMIDLDASLFPEDAGLFDTDRQNKLNEASQYVENAFSSVDHIQVNDKDVLELKSTVTRQLNNFNAKISLLYSMLPDRNPGAIKVDAEYAYDSSIDMYDDITQVVCILVVICNVIMRLAHKSCEFIIGIAVLLIKLAMSTTPGSMTVDTDGQARYSPRQEEILKRIPNTLEAALRKFALDGKFQLYATCPTCNYTNTGNRLRTSARIVFPPKCVNQIVGQSGKRHCDTPLLRQRPDGSSQPVKPYLVGSVSDYLARSLADRTYLDQSLEAVDKAWESLRNDTLPFEEESRSVFDSKFLRGFKGPDGKYFLDRGSKIRLAFSLHMDFFNPNGNRKRGNSNSIGVISAANLALDPSIRYLPEYIFLGGIIPGPREPPHEEADHFVRPIIEQFASAWNPGLYISRTALCSRGAVVESAIILSVNDLPAARKIAGFQGVGSDFICSVCQLNGHHNMFNTDFKQWVKRNVVDIRRQAEAWRDASTSSERELIYQRHGVRWSSLWLLEYWDPTCMLVIDSMHCLMEGLIHYHCRYVLRLDAAGMKVAKDGYRYAYSYPWVAYSDQIAPPQYKVEAKHIGQVRKIQKALCLALEGDKAITLNSLWTRLENLTKPSLVFVAWTLRLTDSVLFTPDERILNVWRARELTEAQKKGKEYIHWKEGEITLKYKAHYVALLLTWRLKQPNSASHNLPKTGTPSTLEHIQTVISHTLTPSWVSSIPKNYGEASAGTIKADEWCTL